MQAFDEASEHGLTRRRGDTASSEALAAFYHRVVTLRFKNFGLGRRPRRLSREGHTVGARLGQVALRAALRLDAGPHPHVRHGAEEGRAAWAAKAGT